jgi:hypothetical protein
VENVAMREYSCGNAKEMRNRAVLLLLEDRPQFGASVEIRHEDTEGTKKTR